MAAQQTRVVPFGQVVIGPPGSGKTTYCHGVYQYLRSLGRKVAVVNLDPANDELPYDCAISISEIVTLNAVMEQLHLGPNGGLIYCMEYLEKNMDWLKKRLDQFQSYYFLFDCPGQAELYTHHDSVHVLVQQLTKWGYRLASVHLVDSHHCVDPTKFISALTLSLQTMLRLDLPHVNVLSKIDLLESFGPLAFDLEFYTQVLDLKYLLDLLERDHFGKKYRALSSALCELVEDFGLVSFQTLNIEDKESVHLLLKVVDKANGYIYGYIDEPKDFYMDPKARGSAPVQPQHADDLIVKEHFESLARSMNGMDLEEDGDDTN